MSSRVTKSGGRKTTRPKRRTGKKTKGSSLGKRKSTTKKKRTGTRKRPTRAHKYHKLSMGPDTRKVKRKRRVKRVRAGAEISLAQLQKEAKKLGIPLSKDGKRKTKTSLSRSIAYRK